MIANSVTQRVLTSLLVASALTTAAPAAPPAAGTSTAPATRPATAPTSMPAIRIGYDTTRITKPLKPDGTPDYIAAINEIYSKGVTKDNNAAVSLIQVLGPVMIAEQDRQKAFKILGIELRPDHKFLDLKSLDAKVAEKASKNAWAAKDFPELANWLRDNKDFLSALAEATKKTRYFTPCIPSNSGALIETLMPTMKAYRKLAHALVARANLALHEGRVADAWSDTLAVYRFSNLLEQDWTLIGKLVAVIISGRADSSAQRIAASGLVTPDMARNFMSQLSSLGRTPKIIDSIDVGERFWVLDLAFFFFRPAKLAVAESPGEGPDIVGTQAFMARYAERVDINKVLITANGLFDQMIQGLQETNLRTREARIEAINDRIAKLREAASPLPDIDASSQKITEWASAFHSSTFVPTLLRAQFLADKARITRELTLLSFALAAYKADNAKYPARLADLSPKYIKAVSTDFCADGKELIYKLTNGGYVLYSVGENGKDDEGMTSTQPAGADDIVVRVGDDDRQPATKEGAK